MELSKRRKITNMEELQEEKLRLKVLAAKQKEVLMNDLEYVKATYGPKALLTKAAANAVPETVRRSTIINDPINFIARRVFHKNGDVVSTHSDQGKGNLARNVALSVIEGLGAYLITKYIRRKIF